MDLPQLNSPTGSYALPTSVSAIEVLPNDAGEWARLGLTTQLPEGAEVQVVGSGFNDLTVRVRCGATFYFIYLDDFETVRKRAAASA